MPAKLMKNKRFHCAVKTVLEADSALSVCLRSQARKAVERLQNHAYTRLKLIIRELLR